MDSNREVRARLIEILYERVQYHKDKFVAPILHHEMQSMEVKKNGKVEHSQNSHDDQVFSYLMALYTWYDGKNLAERYNIVKNTIKTDEDEDIEEVEIEDSLEATAKVDVEEISYDPDSELYEELEFLESGSRYITSEDLKNTQFYNIYEMRNRILATNKDARESYCKKTGLDPMMFTDGHHTTFVQLPDILFTGSEESDMFLDDEEYDPYNRSPLAGNLANMWDSL